MRAGGEHALRSQESQDLILSGPSLVGLPDQAEEQQVAQLCQALLLLLGRHLHVGLYLLNPAGVAPEELFGGLAVLVAEREPVILRLHGKIEGFPANVDGKLQQQIPDGVVAVDLEGGEGQVDGASE